MPYQPISLPSVKDIAPYEWKLPAINGGVNYQDLPWNCNDNQSPKAVNVWYNDRILAKRWGYKNLNSTPTGAPILAAYPLTFMGKFVFASGTKLYTMAPGASDVAEIYSGLSATKGCFLKFYGKLYYINGAQYVQYDGTTAKAVEPYIPTVSINRTPTGGGADKEDYNRIGAGFINSFNGDGTSTYYTLSVQNLDNTSVTASIDSGLNYNKVEGTDFSVNRTTGVVTWNSAPPSGNNNVLIKAYKTNADNLNQFLTCTQITAFGGSNMGAGDGTRIFYSGNGTQYYYWSEISTSAHSAEYIPLSQYNLIGTSDDPIMGFGIQYETLCIFKARSIYGLTYSYDTSTGKALFPVACINSAIGCDCPGTIQLINNRLVWCNTYGGVYTMVYTNFVAQNKDVKPISRNINGNSRTMGLLQEANLNKAIAFNFDESRGYWLTVNGHVYYWDYGLTPYQNASDYEEAQKALSWWYFEDLPVACYMTDSGKLYFGDSVSGYIAEFGNYYNDNGAGIKASWKLADRNFGYPEMRKTVIEMWISMRSDTATHTKITHYSDRFPNGVDDAKPVVIGAQFSWSTVTWSNLCWGGTAQIQSFYRKVRKKNIKWYAIELSNDVVNEDMNISDMRANVSIDEIDRKG